jgi:hypothetical protein
MPSAELDPAARGRLGELAWAAVVEAAHGRRLRVQVETEAEPLRAAGAAFVTLESGRGLRGCVGALEARLALAAQVAESAHRAAVADPRFPPLRAEELPGLELKISVLGAPEPLAVDSRPALLEALSPGRDGLILECGSQRATFLPAVWSSLLTPESFVRELERKASFASDAWSRGVRCFRYSTQEWKAPRPDPHLARALGL